MTVASKAAGLSFLVLGLISRQSAAQTAFSTCETLKSAVTSASAAASFSLDDDFECTEPINISGETTIDGAGHTITIAATFLTGDSAAELGLFTVEAGGKLELDDVTITSDATDGVRGIYNEGTLTVNNCVFSQLNDVNTNFVTWGGAIYTKSDGNEVTITDSTFSSNLATIGGGAVCADGTDILAVSGSVFVGNEAAGTDEEDSGTGGDIYAARGVTLTVVSSNFTKSLASYGGAAIECCGATISDSQFTATESAMTTEHYGALLIGRPGEDPCPTDLKITNCDFDRCTVDVGNGAGGSMAIFDTSAEVLDCRFESSRGTAVLFQASDASYQLTITSSYFYTNSVPAKEFSLSDFSQGTALAIQNTGLGDGEEPTEMGIFTNVFCFENEPYECEFVYHDTIMEHEGQFKCQICDQDGNRQDPGTGDFLSGTDRSNDSGSDSGSDSWSDSSEAILIGLLIALGLAVVVIGALAVWIFRVKRAGSVRTASNSTPPATVAHHSASA